MREGIAENKSGRTVPGFMTALNWRPALLALLAPLALALTLVAMRRWAPDATAALPPAALVAANSERHAESLGYRVGGEPSIQVSAGPRIFAQEKPYSNLVAVEPDSEARRALIELAPPFRLAARYRTATAANGSTGDLVFEYDWRGLLVGASFGLDGLVVRSLPIPEGNLFADRLAELLLDGPPPVREETGLGGPRELLYRPGIGEPTLYVFLAGSGGWTAQQQPVPSYLASSQNAMPWDMLPAEQLRLYLLSALALLVLVLLFWRLQQRRAGFSHSKAAALLLALGLLPVVGGFDVETSVLVPLILFYVLTQVGVLLVWVVGEAELRDARPGSVEHWDRLVRRRPIRASGSSLLLGIGFGCLLSAGLAASGQGAAALGVGGYGSYLLALPDYWTLPTALNRGVLLAAATAMLVGLGGRLGGRVGASLAALLGGVYWSMVIPVAPIGTALVLGAAAAIAVGWVVWHHGLLALTACCVTGLSLPSAVSAWALSPMMLGTAVLASAPILLLPLGVVLLLRAPRYALDSVEPAYVTDLEHEARLHGEVELLRQMQLSLLPADEHPSLKGLDIAWKMVPAETVGGDFLDLIEDTSGRLWIALADAAGHGISCSVLTAFTKAAVTEHAVAGIGPAEALGRIRRLFGRLERERNLVTLLLAVWDFEQRTITVATAGHPPLLYWDGSDLHEIGEPRPPLGTALPGEETEVRFSCSKGGVVVGSSDGAAEAMSPRDEPFGYDRWSEKIPRLAALPAAKILEELLGAVDRHRDGRPAADDVTTIVLRCPES